MISYKNIAVSVLAGLALIPGVAAEMAMMTGYIMDNLCMNNCESAEPFASCTPDGSNAFYNPEDHTGWCLLLQVCVDSGYSLMSEFPTEDDGRHSVLLTLAGDASQAAAVSFIEMSTVGQKGSDRLPFPKVVVVYDDELAETDDGGVLQVFNASVQDPWEIEGDYFSGADTTQILCPDSTSPDISDNNLCFRSDVSVSIQEDAGTIIIESNGCPDHENMMGSNGTVANFQEDPISIPGADGAAADPCNPCGCNPCGCNPCGCSPCGTDTCSDLCSPCSPCAASDSYVCEIGPVTMAFSEVPITLTYEVGVDESTGMATFSALVEYEGQGWVGFGISPDGSMVGSLAIIGNPDEEVSESNPGKYDLNAKSPNGVVLTAQTLLSGDIMQNDTHTILAFTKFLTEPDELEINPSGENNFLVAGGSSNGLGYHPARHSFTVKLTCPSTSECSAASCGISGCDAQGCDAQGCDSGCSSGCAASCGISGCDAQGCDAQGCDSGCSSGCAASCGISGCDAQGCDAQGCDSGCSSGCDSRVRKLSHVFEDYDPPAWPAPSPEEDEDKDDENPCSPCSSTICQADPCSPCSSTICQADPCSPCSSTVCQADPCSSTTCQADPCSPCEADPCSPSECGGSVCQSGGCSCNAQGCQGCQGECGCTSCGCTSCGCNSCWCGCGSTEGTPTTHGTYQPLFQHYTMEIPQEPVVGEATYLGDDVVGILSNGVLLDSHKQTWAYDSCNGHSDKKHQYHYHIPPICLMESMGVEFADSPSWWINDEGNATRDFEDLASQFPEVGPPSPVIGFARDGHPIFGPYDDVGSLQRGAIYGGSVDECNGKMDSNGNYGYYMTVDPPFAPPCLKGEIGYFAYASSDIACPKEGIMNTIILAESDEASLSKTTTKSGDMEGGTVKEEMGATEEMMESTMLTEDAGVDLSGGVTFNLDNLAGFVCTVLALMF